MKTIINNRRGAVAVEGASGLVPVAPGCALSRTLRWRTSRKGVAAVEAAFALPMLLVLMLGVWQVGQIVRTSKTVADAAREGARVAAGGVSNGTPVTVAVVQQTVRNYLTAAGFPAAAVNGAQISVVNLSADSWTDPCNAQPLDPFSVSVTIPAGAPFNSLRLIPSSMTSWIAVNHLYAQTEWVSINDAQVVVGTQLPY